jgi:formamidopyrimidine-DNA glycosylase
MAVAVAGRRDPLTYAAWVPELPEVETIRRALAPVVEGSVLRSLEILDPRWCEPAAPGELRDAVEGRSVERLARRGKWLDLALAEEVHLVMHLRMTGNLLVADEAPHTRVRFDFGSERVLFTDPRRFGTGVVLLGDAALEEYFSTRVAQARGRRQPVKAFLLTQERVAGVGNIYADEALFRAKIHPLRPVGTLKRGQIEELRGAVVRVLEDGIDAKGASIDDFRNPDGAKGSFQDRFLVHLREGEQCIRCGKTIVKMRAAGRGTYVCPNCQRRPRSSS